MKTKFNFFRTSLYTAFVAVILITGCSKDDQSINPVGDDITRLKATVATADGFAAGTTGGAGGTAVTATSASSFASYATSSTRYIITVSGNLNIGQVKVASNKTIIGASASTTLTGNLAIDGVSNVIIQNLIITNPSGVGTADGIEVSGSTKVFITKCTFTNCSDGSLDVVRASDYVTISWCKFQYPNQTSHNYCNLIGNGDNVTTDRGKLHVTMHHNWYATGCQERMPRVRFGQVHCYNNYYGASGSNYCVGVGNESQILLENSYFEGQSNAWKNYSSSTSTQGKIHWSGLYMVNTSTPTWAPNSSVFTPSYSYSMISGSSVKSAVTTGAGNVHTTTTSPATLTKHGAGSSSQTIALGTAITSFYYSWTNATSASASGLPSGVTASVNTSAQTITISGTPTVAGTFPFTVTTIGGSPNATMSGTITVTGGSTSTMIYQAENAVIVTGVAESKNAGYTGTGYANTDNVKGTYVEWTVNASAAGTYTIFFRYANVGPEDRMADIYVNGTKKLSSVSFASTGAWTTWANTVTKTVTLVSGTNKIKTLSITNLGCANIDYLSVAGSGTLN